MLCHPPCALQQLTCGSQGTDRSQLCSAGGHVSMPAKIGKAAISMPARLAATSAMPEAQQLKQQDAWQDAGEQPSLQLESSTGTLDITAPLHGREQSRASEGWPWVEAFF